MRLLALGAWMPYAAYPSVMALGIGLHLALTAAGTSVFASAYTCIAFGALAVTVLERRLPHRAEWQGRVEDVRSDALYLALVQIALPFVLALSLAGLAVQGLRALGMEPASVWPSSWPVPLQALLMLLSADLLRYWLHVASHRFRAAVAVARGPPFAATPVLVERGALPPAREGAAVPAGRVAVRRPGSVRAGAGALLRLLRHQRLLPAQQRERVPGPVELRDQRARAPPLASLAHRGGVEQQLRQQLHRLGRPLRHALPSGGRRGRRAGAAECGVSAGIRPSAQDALRPAARERPPAAADVDEHPRQLAHRRAHAGASSRGVASARARRAGAATRAGAGCCRTF